MDSSPIPNEMADAFARDGVAVVRAVLDQAELASAALAIDIVLANLSPIAQVASTPDDPGSFTEDFCRWREIPEIERLARYSSATRVAHALVTIRWAAASPGAAVSLGERSSCAVQVARLAAIRRPGRRAGRRGRHGPPARPRRLGRLAPTAAERAEGRMTACAL